jgi:DNA-binding GntR family transcriptional regulator
MVLVESEKRQRAPRTGTDGKGVFTQIAPESLRDKVVASLKDAFFSGQLKPGAAIVERRLAEQMKIGSPAVREALIILQGFVQRIANTGTYVNSFTPDEVRQLYQLRIEYETVALKWAKPRVKDGDFAVLDGLIVAMTEAAVQKNAREFFERDLDFHRYCWKLSGNKFLERSLEIMVPSLFAFILNVSSNQTVDDSVAKRHIAIITALKSIQEPEFTSTIRDVLSGFALDAVSSISGSRASARD